MSTPPATSTTTTGEEFGPTPPPQSAPTTPTVEPVTQPPTKARWGGLRAFLKAAGLLGVLGAVLAGLLLAAFSAPLQKWVGNIVDPARPQIRFVVSDMPGTGWVGATATARFVVENDGQATAANCVLDWHVQDGVADSRSDRFDVPAGQRQTEPMTTAKLASTDPHGSQHVTVTCDDSLRSTAATPIHIKAGTAPRAGSRLDLSTVPVCGRVTTTSALGRGLTTSGIILVDGRCDTASGAEQELGIYSTPTQTGPHAFATVPTGTQLDAACLAAGQTLQNVRAIASSLWIRVQYHGRTGYVPEIWSQHGTLPRC